MNWADFHFIRPYWLFALLPYFVTLIFILRRKLNQGNWSVVCDAELLPYLLQDKMVKQSRWPLASGALAGLISILAIAGPTWQRLPMPVFRNDSALVIALDLSHSMDAADIKPSRLTLARFKIADILKRRKDGQTALLVFASDAYVVTPLTNDTQTIESQLSALTTSIMPNDGNNIAAALQKAKALFQQAGLQKGQLLLITDSGDVSAGISQAKSLEAYQLLVLGVGTADGAPVALADGGFQKDEKGNIIIEKLYSTSLEKLAQAGQGIYQSLTPDDTDIQTLLSAVDSRTHDKGQSQENLILEQWQDFGPWLLMLVVPLAALSFRKGLLSVAILFLLPLPKNAYALEWRDLWQTKDQQAQEAYQQGDYNKAAELFENQDWQAAAQYKSITENQNNTKTEMKEAESALGLYNQANVLAVRQEYEKAIANYAKALNKNPDEGLKNDIEYNKKLIEEALQKKQENKNQQNQDKKKDPKENKDQEQNKQEDKSGQSEQDKDKKDQENKAQDQEDKQQQAEQNEQKPEPKPEQSQASTENQPEKQDAKQDKAQDNKADTAKQEQAQLDKAKDEQEADKKDKSNAAQAQESMSKEQQEAHEQWLKRIPDDPAGLLKRKFKYQYDQRGQQ